MSLVFQRAKSTQDLLPGKLGHWIMQDSWLWQLDWCVCGPKVPSHLNYKMSFDMLWSTLCKCMQLAGWRLKEIANFTISSSTFLTWSRGRNSRLKESRALLSKTSNIMLLHYCLKMCCSLCWNLMTWKSKKKLFSRKFFRLDVSNQPRRDWRSQPLTMKLPTGHNLLAFLKVASVNQPRRLLWPGAARCFAEWHQAWSTRFTFTLSECWKGY